MIRKFIIILIEIVLIIVNVMLLNTKVEAKTMPIDKADLYSKGEIVCFDYNDIGIGVEVIVHKKDGIEYPAYCLNKGKEGVTQENSYTVDIEKLVSDVKVWRAITNGYPFKTPEELGCNNMMEAYAATKMAVYDTMYNYDLDKFKPHNNMESGKRVVKAIKNIITAARNSTENKIWAEVNVEHVIPMWTIDEIDNTCISKTFEVKTSAAIKEYTATLTAEEFETAKIVDINNKERKIFKSGERFKILIPITATEFGGDLYVNIKTDLDTKPILYGEAPDPTLQNLAVVAGRLEPSEVTWRDVCYRNETKLKICKQDGDSLIPLPNAEFTLFDENKNVIYSDLKTDKEGVILLNNILPGKYYIKEVKSPEGYYGIDDLIEVDVKYSEELTIKVNNFKKTEPKEEPKPQDKKETTVGNKKVEKTLPRTGF